ncbi:unnamed protein product [Porites evermanni]|uniref:Uncharacterized protein n=1 Tax=Porites evermanni TaxID=104178 RepID=A0ABN8MJS6_9CNID|nr:unnamed protein product [Porites evermanni]
MLKHFVNVAGVAKWFPHWVLSGNHGHCLSQRRYSSSKSDLDVIIKKMKFRRYRCFEKLEEPPSGLEPLRTMYEELDAVHVRKQLSPAVQPHVLFLRSELVLQRLEYLKPSGLLARQKRKLLERSPPVLVLAEDSQKRGGAILSQGSYSCPE